MKLSRNQMILIAIVAIVAVLMYMKYRKSEGYSLSQVGHCVGAVKSPMDYAMDGCGKDQTSNPAYSPENSYHQIDVGAVDMYPDNHKLSLGKLFQDMRNDWTGPN